MQFSTKMFDLDLKKKKIYFLIFITGTAKFCQDQLNYTIFTDYLRCSFLLKNNK